MTSKIKGTILNGCIAIIDLLLLAGYFLVWSEFYDSLVLCPSLVPEEVTVILFIEDSKLFFCLERYVCTRKKVFLVQALYCELSWMNA